MVSNEICNNLIDDDLDGSIDSADTDCFGVVIEPPEDISNIIVPQGAEGTGLLRQSPGDIGDIITPDFDKAGVADDNDNCSGASNADQRNSDGDAEGDAYDWDQLDSDEDGWLDADDNCEFVSNPDQKNSDTGEGVDPGPGDACDFPSSLIKMKMEY